MNEPGSNGSPPEEDIAAKLVKMVADIKRKAKGRVCRDYKHLRDGWCAEQTNVTGDSLAVLYPTAVACRKFEARMVS